MNGASHEQVVAVAHLLAESLAASGRQETFAGIFTPQLTTGDEVHVTDERGGSEVIGAVTDVTHNFGQNGFYKQAPNQRYPFTGKLICGVCGKPYYYYHYTTTNKQSQWVYRCMSRRTQSAVEVPGQIYTPPHKANYLKDATPELIAYRERYCPPPKSRAMLCTDVRIPIDLPQKAFVRAWNLMVSKQMRYKATLRTAVDTSGDILTRYRAEEMLTLIDEVGKIAEFDYSLMLKTLDYVLVRTDGKLTFIFQSGIKITV